MSWSFESPVSSPVAAALSLVSFSAMSILKMIFFFPGWDMLLSWRVYIYIYFFFLGGGSAVKPYDFRDH